MKHNTQRIITSFLIALVTLGGFEVLIYILNLNQPAIFMQVAFWIFIYLVFKIVFLFDLHFKKRGSLERSRFKHQNVVAGAERALKIYATALWDRVEHLRKWSYLRKWLHFLVLPTFIYWSAITLIYVNFGFGQIQQIVVLLAAGGLILYYWYLKECFYRQKDVVDSDIFIVLKILRICTAGALFAANMAILRRYCLDPWYFSAEVFCYTFLLIYVALYQGGKITGKNILYILLISLVMGIFGQFVYADWSYNYFTAAVFLTAVYNFYGELFHYHIDKALTRDVFWETFFVTIVVCFMVFSATNFSSRLLDSCQYRVF